MAEQVKSIRRPIVTLQLPRNVPALIVYAQGIAKRMIGNPAFPNPSPALSAITAAVDELQAAETAALARTKGATATRNEKRAALVTHLQQLRAHIQATADASATNAASIIESAGVRVKKMATRHARGFVARPGNVSGVARVFAATSARRASYEWQYSTDGGKTWVSAPATLQAKTSIAGLTPGATVHFKSRSVTKAGEGDWSQPVSLLVQ
ncbi:MAG: fibronectin type III domain-containing protein [Myxococcota bacterium]|nr:fibronectin type III domain-containing protein [Myxococcota bacterium]